MLVLKLTHKHFKNKQAILLKLNSNLIKKDFVFTFKLFAFALLIQFGFAVFDLFNGRFYRFDFGSELGIIFFKQTSK